MNAILNPRLFLLVVATALHTHSSRKVVLDSVRDGCIISLNVSTNI